MLQKALDDIVSFTLNLEQYMSHNPGALAMVMPSKRSQLLALVRKFEPYKDQVTPEFMAKNLALLFKVHDVLVGNIARHLMSKQYAGENQSICDSINQHLSIRNPRKLFMDLPRWLSNEFCKGITNFENRGFKADTLRNVYIEHIP